MLSCLASSAFSLKYYKPSAAPAGGPPTSGLVHHYPFTAGDISSGTVKNHVTDTYDGDAIGLCVIETNSMKVTNTTATNSQFSTNYPTTSDYSVSFWVKVTDVENGYGGIIQWDDDQNPTNEITLHYNGGAKKIYFTGTGAPANIQRTQDLTGSFHHIVVTQSSTAGIEVFADNVSRLTYTSASNITRNYLGFGIGKTTTYGVDGFYESVRIYDRVLTVSEVDDLYNYDLA
jgi:hypothetical protein